MRILMAEIEYFVPMETSLDVKYKNKNKKKFKKLLNEILLKMLEKD